MELGEGGKGEKLRVDIKSSTHTYIYTHTQWELSDM